MNKENASEQIRVYLSTYTLLKEKADLKRTSIAQVLLEELAKPRSRKETNSR